MWKNRWGYLFLVITFAVLLFLFSKPFFLYAIIALVILAVAMGIMVRWDAENIHLEIPERFTNLKDDRTSIRLRVGVSHELRATRSLLAEFVICNKMFGRTEEKRLLFQLSRKEEVFEIPVESKACGEISVRCTKACVVDLLKIHRIPVPAFEEITMTIYPEETKMQVELSAATVGMPREEGLMQNRKGNDPSEMFDIREYVPGDDIRSIHWKLSSKSEELIVRQASDPSHYNVILIPDLGLRQKENEVSEEEQSAAVSISIALGECLLKCGIGFCMAIPSGQGLKIQEVQNIREFRQLIPQWMSVQVPEESGIGLQYFMLEHLEQYFTKLLIVSAGIYSQNIGSLGRKIGITVINADENIDTLSAVRVGECEVLSLPTSRKKEDIYRILC